MRRLTVIAALVALCLAPAFSHAAAPAPSPVPPACSASLAAPAVVAAAAGAPAALDLASFTRIPGPCRVFCTNGRSCMGQSYCIQGPGGIVCDGHVFSCFGI
ncbi:MAG TPA: hypothetical protein VIH93_12910 [Thermoanaerobaculia bacterium]